MRTLTGLALCLALFAWAAPAAAKDIIVDEYIEIPTLEEEIVTVRPSHEHVWIPGYWERDPGKWTWQKGHWDKPPHKAAHWQKGHWAYQDGKWNWRRGHWAAGGTRWIVDDVIDVPYAFRENRPAKPSDKNHWVAGHWDWDRGGWFWIPGYYTKKPSPDATWVPGHWEPYGVGGGYWWMGGHWRVK
jgi:hypothetical protein